ncbi:symmetrical bis(5'-nucleosyl)-tetraphosphatase [Aliikangiella marina]|uniref:Bis(5'-nucleosyl)-tetraphosphatase, symmetrical n=1 Tax=Aliikangiella marina TaxID=1712262 RepID=A0A545T967_9GAMM|nr:symmetrical bis(5'-nucleosyl)-tetraphosphatase [Aliikangiella marina]TQV73738.1 symmetrical bis(5'-nucleosyl)-tetraphosphatase [Aliikangiella marina]
MATYAIGDIQGCYQSLQKLLQKIAFDPAKDEIWLVGDLINRGPSSLETLRFVFEHKQSIRCVLGNHDLHFLAVESGAKQATRKDTFNDILAAEDRPKLVNWLRKQPLFYYDARLNTAMVHAGVPPQWKLQKVIEYAYEVSLCIQSNRAKEFYAAMYGNTPNIWSKKLTGMKRLRVITNYLTRMRYCRADGSLELTEKVPVGQQPPELIPWFEVARKPLGCELVFGHWASLQGHCYTNGVYALDTGCAWGGLLTALRLEDKEYFQVKSKEFYEQFTFGK